MPFSSNQNVRVAFREVVHVVREIVKPERIFSLVIHHTLVGLNKFVFSNINVDRLLVGVDSREVVLRMLLAQKAFDLQAFLLLLKPLWQFHLDSDRDWERSLIGAVVLLPLELFP